MHSTSFTYLQTQAPRQHAAHPHVHQLPPRLLHVASAAVASAAIGSAVAASGKAVTAARGSSAAAASAAVVPTARGFGATTCSGDSRSVEEIEAELLGKRAKSYLSSGPFASKQLFGHEVMTSNDFFGALRQENAVAAPSVQVINVYALVNR